MLLPLGRPAFHCFGDIDLALEPVDPAGNLEFMSTMVDKGSRLLDLDLCILLAGLTVEQVEHEGDDGVVLATGVDPGMIDFVSLNNEKLDNDNNAGSLMAG